MKIIMIVIMEMIMKMIMLMKLIMTMTIIVIIIDENVPSIYADPGLFQNRLSHFCNWLFRNQLPSFYSSPNLFLKIPQKTTHVQ